MRFVFVAAWMALISTSTLGQQSGSAQAAAEGVVDLLPTKANWEASMAQSANVYGSATVAEMEGSPAYINELAIIRANPGGLDGFKREISDAFAREMRARYPAMRAAMTAFYAERFSAAELAKLGEFLRSEAGSKFIAVQGQAQQHGAAAGSALGQEVGIAVASAAIARAKASAGAR